MRRCIPKILTTVFVMIFAIQSYGQKTTVNVINGYGFSDEYAYNLGLGFETQVFGYLYSGVRYKTTLENTSIARVGCFCAPPGFIERNLDNRISYITGNMGFRYSFGRVSLQPDLMMGVAFNSYEKAFTSPNDGPPVIVSEKDSGFLFAPGLKILTYFGKVLIGAEGYYIMPSNLESNSNSLETLQLNINIGYIL